ncbi:MAG: hypothetical protein JWO38_756 [Gemmataceae bacterium]|nr:hypothetical protein [Gemmataceae bacterium]
MAQLYLSENKWRMVRRVCRKKRFRYEDARNMTRHDQVHFDFLVENGLAVPAGDEWYELTDKGKAAADLGAYEFEPVRRVDPVRRSTVK